MIRKFYSYVTFPIESLILSPPTGTRETINKPEGGSLFWASGQIEAGGEIYTHWDEYVKYNAFTKGKEYKYVVGVQPNWSDILIIDSDFEYYELYKDHPEFFIRLGWRDLLHLDFSRIPRYYSGIFLSQDCVSSMLFLD